MRFDKFNILPEIKENLKTIGFFRTTDIQFKTIPAILNGEDVLAIAQTGTGKTAAFAIPVINQIHDQKLKGRTRGVTCLVMVPTRELAKQIGRVFAQLSRGTKAVSYAIYGGVEQEQQVNQLVGGVDILIATPGRMFDLISQKHLDVKSVRILVLDEADRMFDLGFLHEIENIKKMLVQRHQTLFFSATISPRIKKLAYSQIKANALRIQISPEMLVSRNVSHFVVKVAMDDKRHLLVNFFKANPDAKTIIFVRTQVRADRVLAHLAKNGIEAVGLHGGMEQKAREDNLESFSTRKGGALVATDLSARGIDVPGITHVINYDVPDKPENYVHRVGRTGRGFAKGDAITFCSPEEMGKLDQVQAIIGTPIDDLNVDANFLKEELVPKLESLAISEMLAFEEARFEESLHRPQKKKKKTKKRDEKSRT